MEDAEQTEQASVGPLTMVVCIKQVPPQAHEALANAMANGVDRAIHLNDRALGGADTAATARTLALAISQ